MPLAAGARLGPYEIAAPIGKGGMGEVYRARDTKLDRDVAIKVLPEEFARDEERLARFEREAKLLASLNHPNIASIYGLEDSDGVIALILELVEGPTLAERIAKDAIPVEEALPIARQMAEALEAGHEAGVIHRDVKPANVKVKEDGTVKVLDYGLAKALEGEAASGTDSELSQSPTLTRHGTQIGVILGTAAYMSPEQAKGKRVDKRADVWAFGAVVFEMLTGERAFGGGDVSDTLAAVLRAEPDFDSLPAETPEPLKKVLELCLTKDVKARARDIGDVRLAMDGAFVTERAESSPAAKRPTPLGVLAGFLLGGLVVGALLSSVRDSAPPRVMRFSAEVGKLFSEGGETVRITPDGRTLVYIGRREDSRSSEVFVRSLDVAEATVVPGTEGAGTIALSPDGESVVFLSNKTRSVQQTPLAGGTVVPVLHDFARGLSWGDDSTIVYGSLEGGLWRVPATGGEPERVTEAAPGRWHARPYHLPDSEGLLLADASLEDSYVAVLPRDAREVR